MKAKDFLKINGWTDVVLNKDMPRVLTSDAMNFYTSELRDYIETLQQKLEQLEQMT